MQSLAFRRFGSPPTHSTLAPRANRAGDRWRILPLRREERRLSRPTTRRFAAARGLRTARMDLDTSSQLTTPWQSLVELVHAATEPQRPPIWLTSRSPE